MKPDTTLVPYEHAHNRVVATRQTTGWLALRYEPQNPPDEYLPDTSNDSEASL